MKKRLFLIFMLTLVIFLTGCGKENKEKLRQNFINDTSSLKGYYMEGVLSITNNDDTYNYDVKVGFKKDDILKRYPHYEKRLFVIDAMDFGMMNGEKVLKSAIKLIKSNKK